MEHGIDMPVRIFAVGYEAQFMGGDIQLGDHHDEYRWVDLKDFKPEELFAGGWRKGLQEYISTLNQIAT